MIKFAFVLTLIASPAFAQSWTSTTNGNQTQSYSSDGWSGQSTTNGNQTQSYFSGPNGQQHSCTSTNYGNQTQTYCQ